MFLEPPIATTETPSVLETSTPALGQRFEGKLVR